MDTAEWLRTLVDYGGEMRFADLANLAALQHEADLCDQCWHQQNYESGDYDGDELHSGECYDVVSGCGDPCKLCVSLRAAEDFRNKYDD